MRVPWFSHSGGCVLGAARALERAGGRRVAFSVCTDQLKRSMVARAVRSKACRHRKPRDRVGREGVYDAFD